MAIRWNTELLRDICIFPTAIAENELRFASHPQLKVLIWFAAHEKENATAETCATALHLPQETVEAAVEYWVSRGVFTADGITPPPAPAPAPAPVQSEQTVAQPAVTARPQAVKPQMKEVIRKQTECPEFSALLETISARLGKPLSHTDMETLLYLYDTADIDGSVILMGVGYAVSRGKFGMRYIETVLLNWQDNGITSVDAAEEHLQFLEKKDRAADKVRAMLGRTRELDARQRQMAYTWVYEWNFSDEMIRLALDKAQEKSGSVIPYAHKILAGWFDEGVTDAKAVQTIAADKTPAARRKGKTEETSLDLQGYESMLEDYVPPIPRKE